jgi:hypothetical protein
LHFRERHKQKKLVKKSREEKGSMILSSMKLADPLEEKIQKKKKKLEKKQEKQGQDFVFI